MAARLPRLSAALLAAALAAGTRVAAAQEPHVGAGQRQVLTAESIRQAGVTRLGEVLRLAVGWDPATIDEYTWQAAPGALSAPGQMEWIVLVDGQRMDLELFGVTALDRLPASLAAIDSIVLVSAPVLEAGTLAARGLVHIHTTRPPSGPSAHGRYVTGGETGDPGPYAFLDPAAPNVDRLGHDASLGAAYGGRGWYAAADLTLATHIASDPALLTRLYGAGAGFPRLELTAPSLRAGLDALGGRHELLAGRSTFDDWFRLAGYDREIAARSTFLHAGATGSVGAGRGLALRYRAGYGRTAIDAAPDRFAPDFSWRRGTARASVELDRRQAGRTLRVGAGVARTAVESPYPLAALPLVEAQLFGEVEYGLAPALRQSVAWSLAAGGGDVGGGLIVRHDWSAGPRDRLDLTLGADRPLPATDWSLPTLVERGYGWPGDHGVDVLFDDPAGRAWRLTADLGWRHRLAARTTVSATAYYRAFRSARLTSRSLTFDPADFSFGGPMRVASGRRGQVGGALVRVESAVTPRLDVRAWYRARAVLAGDALVRDAWNVTPAHTAGARAAFAAARNFDLHAMLTVRSATTWADFAAAEAQSEGRYRARVPASAALELAAQKWLWHRRLRLQLAVRNLFDAPVRSHPIGATSGLAFLFQVEAMLPGQAAVR